MKNKKSSNFFSLLGASGNGRGDIRVCTDGSVLALGNPAFAQTNSTEKKRIITRQPRNSDTLCYHDYSRLAMKVSEHKYSYIYIYICVYIGVVLERVTERWRERERSVIYTGLLLSTAHFPGYMGFPRYRASFLSFFLLLAKHRRVRTGLWASTHLPPKSSCLLVSLRWNGVHVFTMRFVMRFQRLVATGLHIVLIMLLTKYLQRCLLICSAQINSKRKLHTCT